MSHTRTTLRRPDGVDLAVHRWDPARPRATVFYIHGMQSHAGWLFETGPALAERGVRLIAVDRRGSGASGGMRGDVGSNREWLDDYAAAFNVVAEEASGLPVAIVGQSRGAAIAACVAARVRCDALLLCAPYINQLRPATYQDAGDPERTIRITLDDDRYTRDPRYLAFMKDDPLMLRAITARYAAALNGLDEELGALGDALRALPALFLAPAEDRIVDLARAEAAFATLTGRRGLVVRCPAEDHYIEFTSWRSELWSFVATFAITRGFTAAGG